MAVSRTNVESGFSRTNVESGFSRTRTMVQRDYKLRSGTLAALLVPGCAYLAWQSSLPPVTEHDSLYGIGGVLLGLFICSRPATNGIDVLIFERLSLRRVMAGASGLAWLLLNAVVMLVGWFVIVAGAIRMSIKNE
jgi:hypothetical protein